MDASSDSVTKNRSGDLAVSACPALCLVLVWITLILSLPQFVIYLTLKPNEDAVRPFPHPPTHDLIGLVLPLLPSAVYASDSNSCVVLSAWRVPATSPHLLL